MSKRGPRTLLFFRARSPELLLHYHAQCQVFQRSPQTASSAKELLTRFVKTARDWYTSSHTGNSIFRKRPQSHTEAQHGAAQGGAAIALVKCGLSVTRQHCGWFEPLVEYLVKHGVLALLYVASYRPPLFGACFIAYHLSYCADLVVATSIYHHRGKHWLTRRIAERILQLFSNYYELMTNERLLQFSRQSSNLSRAQSSLNKVIPGLRSVIIASARRNRNDLTTPLDLSERAADALHRSLAEQALSFVAKGFVWASVLRRSLGAEQRTALTATETTRHADDLIQTLSSCVWNMTIPHTALVVASVVTLVHWQPSSYTPTILCYAYKIISNLMTCFVTDDVRKQGPHWKLLGLPVFAKFIERTLRYAISSELGRGDSASRYFLFILFHIGFGERRTLRTKAEMDSNCGVVCCGSRFAFERRRTVCR